MNIKNHRHKGLIIVDILTAMSLVAVFVVLITSSSAGIRDVFVVAKERDRLLDIYEIYAGEFEGMLPYESRVRVVPPQDIDEGTTTLRAVAGWYGDERVETDVSISSDSSGPSDHLRHPSIMFSAVRAHPLMQDEDVVGSALCAVDLTRTNTIGSYDVVTTTQTDYDVNPILLPIDPLLPLTDIEVRNGIAYLSSDSTRASDPDFMIIDIHDPDEPYIRSSINTGPGLSSFALVGDHVYAAAASTAAQLHVIRVDTIDALILEAKYQLPMPYATSTPPYGASIAYRRDNIYLGTEKWDGEEFSVIDVTDPGRPVKVSGLELGNQINDILVRDEYAYVAGAGLHQFGLIDISDESQPQAMNWLIPSSWERQEGTRLDHFEDTIHAGRTAGGFNIVKDHELFAWATTSLTTLLDPVSRDIKGGIYGIIADRSHLYTVTGDIDKEIRIFTRDLGDVESISLPVAPQNLTCDNDRLYVLARTAPAIYEIRIKIK